MPTIQKRGNTYQITVNNGTKNGKRCRETATFKPDPDMTPKQIEKAVQAFAIDFERKVKSGASFDGEKMTLRDFIPLYFEVREDELKITTREEIQRELDRHILPELGDIAVAKITVAHVQRFKKTLKKPTMQGGKTLAPSTQKRIFDTLSGILRQAEKLDIISVNPCRKAGTVNVHSMKQSENFLNDEQAPALYEYLSKLGLNRRVFFTLAFTTGLRLGELVGLNFKDINFSETEGVLRVSRSIATVKGGQIETTPKSAAGYRSVNVGKDLERLLKDLKWYYNGEAVRLGDEYEHSDYIFRQWNGKRLHHDTPRKWWNQLVKAFNKDHPELAISGVTLHGVRHTFATLLYSDFADIKTVQETLGHSKASTTMDIYAHALDKKKSGALASYRKALSS